MFKLDPDIIKTNILSKFEKDWVKTVASRVCNEKIVNEKTTTTTDDGHSSILKAHPEQSSGELKTQNIFIHFRP